MALNKEQKYLIEKEIEFIKDSRELNKFDLSLHLHLTISIAIALIVIICGLLIKNSFERIDLLIIFIFLYVFFLMIMYFFFVKPTKNNFVNKDKLVRKKYKKLGINVDTLNKELDKI